ncbi:MAG: SAM-dependent methyltransferase [Aeromicrobium sp.]|jgi:S-adenosylmethionine-dependent methyltransferase|nr:SAM-dependent methyltransferase [Aeromicrobium sp.]
MGPVRTELMWQSVVDAVDVAGGAEALDVLDLGGGTGGDAVRLALLGHRVAVVDPSPDALASLSRRAIDSGLNPTVHGILGDAADLLDHVQPASYDLVICHGVLEHVDDPAQALAAIATVLRPGGHVSVVVAGRNAAVTARALAGDFDAARSLLTTTAASWDVRALGPRRFVLDEIQSLLTALGFVPVVTNGLRVFADLVPSAIVDGEPGAREALYELERLVRTSHDFTSLSAGLQSIARLDLPVAPPDPGGNSAAL